MDTQCDLLENTNRLSGNNYAWDACPPELLLMIMNYFNVRTDTETLLNCLAVNRRWWNVVSSLIEHRIGLHDFLKLSLSDGGAPFRKRSTFRSISDVLMNLCLWKDVNCTKITGNYNYDLCEVININVYKDQMIVVTDRDVKYFSVKNHQLLKTLPIRCSNFDENEFMLLKMDHMILEEMTLYGKLTDRSSVDDRFKFIVNNVNFYKIYDNCCYYTTRNLYIFMVKWENSKWHGRVVGRYFGHGTVTDVIVHGEDILVLLNWGGILLADIGSRRLKLISRKKTSVVFELPSYASKPLLYDKFGVIATVPSFYPLNFNYNDMYWILECPDLTCCLKHGNMILLGYRYGKVEIYNPESFTNVMRQFEPEVTVRVQNLAPDYKQHDASVRHLEVAEVEDAHILIIATSAYVHQVTLDHRLL